MDHSATEYAKLHRQAIENWPAPARERLKADLAKEGRSLTSYLSSVGQRAKDRYDSLISQMQHDPKTQALPYQERVAKLQSLPEIANEIVLNEIVNPEPQAA